MQTQEIPMLQVARWPRKTEEGQGWGAKEEYVPPLQEVSSQEAPSSQTGQVHVEQEVQGLPLQINLQRAPLNACHPLHRGVAFKPHHKFLDKLDGYTSEGNKSGDDWQCAGTPEDKENNNDKWIRVTGNGKTKNLLNPKPNPKVHNAFAILSQPDTPTHYNALSPTQQINNDKTIIPPGPKGHLRQQKNAWHQHIKQTLWRLHKSDDLFLDNSIT
jgi:hypothetical protein